VTPHLSAAHETTARSEYGRNGRTGGSPTMAIDIDNLKRLNKATVIGVDGTKLGTVGAVYYDNNTDHPAWIAVRTGLFGSHVSLVPLAAAELRGEDLHVPFNKQQLKTAPHHDPGQELSPQDEIWRASQIPDTGPNKVRPGTEDDLCENGAGSSHLSSRTRP
jgi:hypothetical protein